MNCCNPSLEKGNTYFGYPSNYNKRYGRPIMYTSHLKVDKGDEDKEESEDEETKKRKKHEKISD